MTAMASRSTTRLGAAAWHPMKGVRVRGPVPAGLWLALPGVAALTLGTGLPAVALATRVGLAALGLLLVAGGGLVARGAMGVGRDCPRSARRSLPARQAGAVPVGSHRVGRDAQGRVPSARGGHERERRTVDLRARVELPAARHAWRKR